MVLSGQFVSTATASLTIPGVHVQPTPVRAKDWRMQIQADAALEWIARSLDTHMTRVMDL
jgi:hypothetical protein